jgi:hypothetical protein
MRAAMELLLTSALVLLGCVLSGCLGFFIGHDRPAEE